MKRIFFASVMLALALLAILGITVVFAEDPDVFPLCTNPRAVNYPGDDIIQAIKADGGKVVDDGSCYCMRMIYDKWGELTGTEDISCKMADDSYSQYFNALEWNGSGWIINRELGPEDTPWLEPVIVGGCTDPEAANWMNPQWWEGYEIIEDGSCFYDGTPLVTWHHLSPGLIMFLPR